MSKLCAVFFIFLTTLLSPLTWGWNTYGHLLLTDLAVAKLEPAKQRYYEQLAYGLVRQMDAQKRLYLMRTYTGTSAVAQLSVFPDDWRGRKVSELYEEYGEGLPMSLEPYAESTTDTWHYINQQYSPNTEPQFCAMEKEDVASVLPDLFTAYAESETEASKALTLAFILHLVSDAHNPMHTMTKLGDDCETDRGGNRFCVAYSRGSSACEENLHQAWDRGMGFFDDYEKVADALDVVARVEVDEEAAKVLNPSVWVAEGFDLARLVYSAEDGEPLDPYYKDEGKIISYELIALGADRLAAILDEL